MQQPITITAISNDISYESVFSKQLEYLSNKNDALITISASVLQKI